MKIKKEHYQTLVYQVESVLNQNPNCIMVYKQNALSLTRFIWDVWHKACFDNKYEFSDILYQYLNDSHIDTALKHALCVYYERGLFDKI